MPQWILLSSAGKFAGESHNEQQTQLATDLSAESEVLQWEIHYLEDADLSSFNTFGTSY
ncbi:hypothetical protein HC928_07765 [bacterium]|nr:hypothetical protein [bacterium]